MEMEIEKVEQLTKQLECLFDKPGLNRRNFMLAGAGALAPVNIPLAANNVTGA